MQIVNRIPLTHQGIRIQLVKRRTQELIEDYLSSLDQRFSIKAIQIGSYKSQWGSCSSKGVMKFHFKLSLLPLPLVHYVIAHELSHLSHMNHSHTFWKAVEFLCPNHKICRKLLRKYLP